MVDAVTLGSLRRLKFPTVQNLILTNSNSVAGVPNYSFLYESTQDNITAHAGGGQTSAQQLYAEVNRITTVATAGDSVMLPPAVVNQGVTQQAGLTIFIINHGANNMQVYGNGTDTIDDVATATGVTQMPGSATIYTCTTTGKWYANGLGEGYIGSLLTLNYQTNVSAAGTTQASGTQLTSQIAVVNTVGAGAGVNLPGLVVSNTTQSSGVQVAIINNGANPLLVYPAIGATNDTINGQASTVGVSIFPGTVANFVSAANGVWFVEAATTKSAVSNTVASAASVTATAAQLTGGASEVTLTITGSTTVTTLTTDAAANIVKALHSPVVGTSYKLRIVNVNGVATSSLTGGTNVTVSSAASGVVTIPASGWRDFIVTVTAVGTPAVTMVSVATGTWS